MEHIYQFTIDGKLELIRVPKLGVHTTFLALYCYDPIPVTTEQLVESTNLVKKTITGYLAKEKYKKYVIKVAESLFRLSHEGKFWVISEILPSIEQLIPRDVSAEEE